MRIRFTPLLLLAAACGRPADESGAASAPPLEVPAGMVKVTLAVDGMTCAHCVKSVDASLRTVEGVHAVRVDLKKGVAECAVRKDVDPHHLAAALGKDYPATVR